MTAGASCEATAPTLPSPLTLRALLVQQLPVLFFLSMTRCSFVSVWCALLRRMPLGQQRYAFRIHRVYVHARTLVACMLTCGLCICAYLREVHDACKVHSTPPIERVTSAICVLCLFFGCDAVNSLVALGVLRTLIDDHPSSVTFTCVLVLQSIDNDRRHLFEAAGLVVAAAFLSICEGDPMRPPHGLVFGAAVLACNRVWRLVVVATSLIIRTVLQPARLRPHETRARARS